MLFAHTEHKDCNLISGFQEQLSDAKIPSVIHNVTLIPSANSVVSYLIGYATAVIPSATIFPTHERIFDRDIVLGLYARSILYSLWCDGKTGMRIASKHLSTVTR